MNEPLEGLVNAVGGMAELVLLYYRSLMDSGATEAEAALLTKLFIEVTVGPPQRGKE